MCHLIQNAKILIFGVLVFGFCSNVEGQVVQLPCTGFATGTTAECAYLDAIEDYFANAEGIIAFGEWLGLEYVETEYPFVLFNELPDGTFEAEAGGNIIFIGEHGWGWWWPSIG